MGYPGISGYHITPQEFFSRKLSKDIVRNTIWGRKIRKLTRTVFFLIVLNLTYLPRYNDRVIMISEQSPKHCQYHLFFDVQSLSLVWLFVTPCTVRTWAHLPFKSPRVFSNPWPLSQWCFAAILSSFVPFFSCSQSFPASIYFQWFCFWPQVANILALHVQHQYLWE